jgi:hypothetical protein
MRKPDGSDKCKYPRSDYFAPHGIVPNFPQFFEHLGEHSLALPNNLSQSETHASRIANPK